MKASTELKKAIHLMEDGWIGLAADLAGHAANAGLGLAKDAAIGAVKGAYKVGSAVANDAAQTGLNAVTNVKRALNWGVRPGGGQQSISVDHSMSNKAQSRPISRTPPEHVAPRAPFTPGYTSAQHSASSPQHPNSPAPTKPAPAADPDGNPEPGAPGPTEGVIRFRKKKRIMEVGGGGSGGGGGAGIGGGAGMGGGGTGGGGAMGGPGMGSAPGGMGGGPGCGPSPMGGGGPRPGVGPTDGTSMRNVGAVGYPLLWYPWWLTDPRYSKKKKNRANNS